MSDPLRSDSPRTCDAAPEPDRDAKIEQLLLNGLDHYFAAEYEQAVNVWTRALFLDRSHARARAYIDRARSAQAERQRQSEELLQNGVAAFHRGEAGEARRLLEAAMHQGAPSDQALAVLDRLTRFEQGNAAAADAAVRPGRTLLPAYIEGSAVRRRIQAVLWIAGAAALAVTGVMVAGTPRTEWRAWFNLQRTAAPTAALAAPPTANNGLPIPRRGETALGRARQLAAGGRLHDALKTLEAVRPTDPQKPDADRLRAEIQLQLLALSPQRAATPAPVAAESAGRLP